MVCTPFGNQEWWERQTARIWNTAVKCGWNEKEARNETRQIWNYHGMESRRIPHLKHSSHFLPFLRILKKDPITRILAEWWSSGENSWVIYLFCGKTFNTITNKKEHIKVCKSGKQMKMKYPCLFCGKGFPTKKGKTTHMNTCKPKAS